MEIALTFGSQEAISNLSTRAMIWPVGLTGSETSSRILFDLLPAIRELGPDPLNQSPLRVQCPRRLGWKGYRIRFLRVNCPLAL